MYYNNHTWPRTYSHDPTSDETYLTQNTNTKKRGFDVIKHMVLYFTPTVKAYYKQLSVKSVSMLSICFKQHSNRCFKQLSIEFCFNAVWKLFEINLFCTGIHRTILASSPVSIFAMSNVTVLYCIPHNICWISTLWTNLIVRIIQSEGQITRKKSDKDLNLIRFFWRFLRFLRFILRFSRF